MDAADTGVHAAPLLHELVFVDLETTGANPVQHRITEVALIRIRGGEVVERWSSLVNPERDIPPHIQRFTGISDAMVAGAPRFADIAATLFAKLGGAVFVAHNARFDYGFLRQAFLRLGMQFTADVMCTVKLSRGLNPEEPRHNLDAVMQRHGLTCKARHRAMGDTEVLHDLWRKLAGEFAPARLAGAAARAMLSAPRLPAQLPPTLPDELPDGPGVYRYLDAQGAVLFVGRSSALRERILRQLSVERQGARERALSGATHSVVWRETGGELGALLLEADWRKRHAPRCGISRRARAQSTTLQVAADGSGRVHGVPLDAVGVDVTSCFGVFQTDTDAGKAVREIARAQRLCLKIMGFEDTPGSCLAYQRHECRGACVGKEPVALHEVRLRIALAALKIKAWPFRGTIGIREGSEMHVLEQWRYVGTAASDAELEELLQARVERDFDADTYRILIRYLANHARLDWCNLSDPVEA